MEPDSTAPTQSLWDEYKYRHDLIWQRNFKFTAAIVLISTLPYVKQDIVRLLDYWILFAPGVATILAGFLFLVIENELDTFGRIKEAYRRQQNKLLDFDLQHKHNESSFACFVRLYHVSLIVLSVGNGLIVALVWIPRVLVAQPGSPPLP